MDKDREQIITECYTCAYKETVPGTCHIKCNNPDPEMKGDPYGVRNGWFFYPILFDPTWKMKKCTNCNSSEAPKQAVSHAVSEEKTANTAKDSL